MTDTLLLALMAILAVAAIVEVTLWVHWTNEAGRRAEAEEQRR